MVPGGDESEADVDGQDDASAPARRNTSRDLNSVALQMRRGTMGMDVCGRHPTSKAGEYFRANIWSWPPIHALIVQLCSDLLDEETVEKLAFNDGAGPEDQATCTEMANRFERWLEHHICGHSL